MRGLYYATPWDAKDSISVFLLLPLYALDIAVALPSYSLVKRALLLSSTAVLRECVTIAHIRISACAFVTLMPSQSRGQS
jgi:hypothetical protein